jgi:2TM domain
MSTSETREAAGVDDLRATAVARLRKRRELGAHALAYVLVNLFLNGIWLLTTPGGFYWPMFPMLGWGIGLAFHIWDVFIGSDPSEEAIRAEMERLRGR